MENATWCANCLAALAPDGPHPDFCSPGCAKAWRRTRLGLTRAEAAAAAGSASADFRRRVSPVLVREALDAANRRRPRAS